jgi:hypothetical protein
MRSGPRAGGAVSELAGRLRRKEAVMAAPVPTLPPESDYTNALDALSAAFDAVEGLVWRVKATVDANDVIPTLSDLGRLWSFADSVRLKAHGLTDEGNQVAELLIDLDCMRLDATVV